MAYSSAASRHHGDVCIVDDGSRLRPLPLYSSALSNRTKSISDGVHNTTTVAHRARHRRRPGGRHSMVAVLLAIILLVSQASVAGGLAADSDRKSRRKQSLPTVLPDTAFDSDSPRSLMMTSSSGGNHYVAASAVDEPSSAGNASHSLAMHLSRNSSTKRSGQEAATLATTGASTTTSATTTKWIGDERFVNPRPADLMIECKQLRSKRYITDGFCTSIKAVVDVVCTGTCLPIRQLPWYAEFIKVWSHAKTLQYRCVDDDVRRKDVLFACDNGETRSYRIRVVRSCKCKRYVHSQNESPASPSRKKKNRKKSRRSAWIADEAVDDEEENAESSMFADDNDGFFKDEY